MYKVTIEYKCSYDEFVKPSVYLCKQEPAQLYSFVKIKVDNDTIWLPKDNIHRMVVSHY